MILILALAILLNSAEAILEAIFTQKNPKIHAWVEKLHIEIVIFIFILWGIFAYNFDAYYVPYWKLFLGFWFVRFMIYDFVWNLTTIILGVRIPIWYYGPENDPKFYDRVMISLGSWGWFMKFVLGIIGIVFLLGIE
jgi:hypothetical protein